MPPARKGRAEWGHLAGAWEPDDFRDLSEARKLKLSAAGTWGLWPSIDRPKGTWVGWGVGVAWARANPEHCDLSLCFPTEPQGEAGHNWRLQSWVSAPAAQVGERKPRGQRVSRGHRGALGPGAGPGVWGWQQNQRLVCNFSPCEDTGLWGGRGVAGCGLAPTAQTSPPPPAPWPTNRPCPPRPPVHASRGRPGVILGL